MALMRKLTAKIYEIKAHNGNVNCLDLGETGRVLVTGGQDRNVNLWAIGQEECFMSLTGHNRPIDCVRFAYNDDYVYSADDIGIIRRWDLNAQTICSTLNGHMKSVQTLDFNPSGEYVVSGSNDTTVRLWDVRNQNKCIKIYRGHIAHVNSVKFSPDGLWIASAGTEGSVIIWDIRKSKQIMDFYDQAPITCIQFHPFEFLLAVGRNDGTICIYDLERQERISRTDARNQFYGYPIKCITFSDNGECLFVGTSAGISVIGWEPDREYDYIKSTWTALGDMKVVNKKLIMGSYENDCVTINALSIDRVIPFYNPSNEPSAFNHNSTTRKSFSRGNQKLRLTITGPKASRLVEENEGSKSPSLDGHSSPNLSLELVDESNGDSSVTSSSQQVPPYSLNGLNSNLTAFEGSGGGGGEPSPLAYSPHKLHSQTPYNFSSIASSTTGYSSLSGNGFSAMSFEGPSSLKMPGEYGGGGGSESEATVEFSQMAPDSYDIQSSEFNLNESNPPIISNYDHNEMAEDFPVNQNNHQMNGGPRSSTTTTIGGSSGTSERSGGGVGGSVSAIRTSKTKTSSSHIQKRSAQVSISSNAGTRSSLQQQRSKLSQMSSVSTTDLHKMDDNMVLKKSTSSHLIAQRGGKSSGQQQSLMNKENNRNKNINVQIITKPPTRSRTTLDLRSSHKQTASSATAAGGTAGHRQSYRISSFSTDTHASGNIPVSYRPDPSLLTQPNSVRQTPMDDSEIQMLSAAHEHIYQELSNRYATLQLIRNSTRSHDIVGALKQAIKMNGRTVFVDLLGAILEKTSSWNLDLCLLLLPEIYELLQSQHKFHYTRACDTLRVILSNFLPIIQENLDPWAASGLGVDVTREERQRKCIECQSWLLQIRNLPETSHFGTTLSQLQNMIAI